MTIKQLINTLRCIETLKTRLTIRVGTFDCVDVAPVVDWSLIYYHSVHHTLYIQLGKIISHNIYIKIKKSRILIHDMVTLLICNARETIHHATCDRILRIQNIFSLRWPCFFNSKTIYRFSYYERSGTLLAPTLYCRVLAVQGAATLRGSSPTKLL